MPAVRLDIRVPAADWLGTFDTLELWRSKLTEDGPFEEITAADYAPARLTSGVIGSLVNAAGLRLDLQAGDAALTHTFTGVNPLALSNVRDQLDGLGALLQCTEEAGKLTLSTVQTGLAASLQVGGGSAAAVLRLAGLAVAEGRDPRLSLVEGVEVYSFLDPHGDEDFTYKARFRARLTGVQSALSAPITRAIGVSPTQIIRGFVRLADVAGRPLLGHAVLIHNNFTGAVIDQFTMAGGSQSRLTDKDGYVEFRLVRGLKITVAITGTNLVRDLVVPADPAITTFNLLDPALGKDDLFQVQVPQLDVAARRSISG